MWLRTKGSGLVGRNVLKSVYLERTNGGGHEGSKVRRKRRGALTTKVSQSDWTLPRGDFPAGEAGGDRGRF